MNASDGVIRSALRTLYDCARKSAPPFFKFDNFKLGF